MKIHMVLVSLIVLGFISHAYAEPIDVANSSFEDPSTTTFAGGATDWTSGLCGVFSNSAGYGKSITNTDGSQLAYMATDASNGYFFQFLTNTFESGKSYNLTVGVAARSDEPSDATDNMQIRLLYGGNTSNVAAFKEVAYGGLSDTELTYYTATLSTVSSGDAWAGQTIGIWLGSTYRAETETGTNHDWTLDHVQLTTSTIPEPNSFVLLVFGMISLIAYTWRKRK